MVEEMIAEGMSPDEIVTVLEEQFGVTSGDAELLVDTALGGPGDLLTEDDPGDLTADGEPDVSDKAMVALYPRAEERDALGSELEPETLHVTLCYLGDAAGVDLGAVRAAIAYIARGQAPLEGRVSGIGRFSPGEDGTPVFAIPSVKGLAELYGDVVEALAMYGISSPTEHGFNPHITLAYVEDPDAELPTVPDVPLHFDAITLTQGDVREDYALEG